MTRAWVAAISFSLIVLGSVVFLAFGLLQADLGPVEMSKEDALLAYRVTSEYQRVMGDLYKKYAVTPDSHRLDVMRGVFVPIANESKKEEEK